MDQLAIALTGSIAIWLVNDQREPWRKWASVFGLAGQPFWVYSAFIAEQWGVLALTAIYTVAWARGFRNAWLQPSGAGPAPLGLYSRPRKATSGVLRRLPGEGALPASQQALEPMIRTAAPPHYTPVQ